MMKSMKRMVLTGAAAAVMITATAVPAMAQGFDGVVDNFAGGYLPDPVGADTYFYGADTQFFDPCAPFGALQYNPEQGC